MYANHFPDPLNASDLRDNSVHAPFDAICHLICSFLSTRKYITSRSDLQQILSHFQASYFIRPAPRKLALLDQGLCALSREAELANYRDDLRLIKILRTSFDIPSNEEPPTPSDWYVVDGVTVSGHLFQL